MLYEKELTEQIIGALIEVHRALGPGLLEAAYQACVAREFALQGIPFEQERPLPLEYKGVHVDCGYRLDFVVAGKVVVELKAVEALLPIHEAQLLTYLKLTRCKDRLARKLQCVDVEAWHQAYGSMNDSVLYQPKSENVSVPSVPPWFIHLRSALSRPLPGLPVQLRMSPQPRPGTDRILDPNLDCRRAGVLVLIYPCGDEPCLVLTRRTDAVDTHRGQISFPGGSLDPGEDAVTAALREGWEELAIEPARVEVMGALSPLYIPPSGFCIYPTVAYAAMRPDFVPNPYEVAEIIEAPLAHLLAPDTRQEEIWEIRGAPVRVPFYAVGHHKVWGATAMVLCELLALLQTSEAERGITDGVAARSMAAAHDPRV